LISKSYPYLSIAKAHNASYSDVLAVGHYLTHGGRCPMDSIQALSGEANADCVAAFAHYCDVRAGVAPFPPT